MLVGMCVAGCMFLLLAMCPEVCLWWPPKQDVPPTQNFPTRELLETFVRELEQWSGRHGRQKEPRKKSDDEAERKLANQITNLRCRTGGREHDWPQDLKDRIDAAAPYFFASQGLHLQSAAECKGIKACGDAKQFLKVLLGLLVVTRNNF